MRKVKVYSLREPLPNPDVKFGKRTQAVLETLKSGSKNAKEIHAALRRYTLGGVGAALSELRKAGMLSE